MSKKIKSTLELAMEKAARLPKLTPEEIRQRLERDHAPRGRAIAERFLAGNLTGAQLHSELSTYAGEEGEIVREACLALMRQSIDLEDADRTARAFDGVGLLVGDECVAEASHRFGELLRDYQEQRRRAFVAAEGAESERLRGLGISGSAVRPNPEQSRIWQDRRSRLTSAFLPRLEEIRRALGDRRSARSESGSGTE